MQSPNSLTSLRLVPMSDSEAALLAKRLMGSYASLNLHDPQVFITELISLLMRYPVWVGERGIAEAKRESPKFVPSVPEVEVACEKAVQQTRRSATYADEWNERAQIQLEERRLIEKQNREESPEYRAAVVAKIRRELRIGEDGKRHPIGETPAQFMVRRGITQEQVDTIPDQPRNPDYWRGVRWSTAAE